MPASLFDEPMLDEIRTAAAVASATEVKVRMGWVEFRLRELGRRVQPFPGDILGRLNCPACITLVVARDSDLSTGVDWEVVNGL